MQSVDITAFYELEKTYQKIANSDTPKEQLQDFIEYCNKEFTEPINIVKTGIIKKIDKCNKNILKKEQG